MKCTNRDIGKLISLYEFDQLTKENKKRFEAHLLDCDYCFQNLHDLAPVVAQMRENPQHFLSALTRKADVPFHSKIKKSLLSSFTNLVEAFVSLPRLVKWAAPATAIAAILFLILLQPSAQLADLARIEPLSYRPLQIRGGGEEDQLFEEGMQFYVKKEYDPAIKKLLLAAEKKPDNISFQFYLGLTYLLAETPDKAIEHFEKTLALGGNSLTEKTFWYSGQAYLLKNDGERALEAFQKVVEMEGDYELEARGMVGVITKLTQK